MPQRVRVPLRVIVGFYSDATVSVYTKVAALERRKTGCEAGVAYLAALLGISRSTVERALTELMRPAPDDDIAEVTSYRRTLPGGTGTTAVRRVRAVGRTEHGAWVPTRAAEALNPRQLRAYAALSYATATGHHITLTDLGSLLRHRSGKKAGQPLDPRSVRRILRVLEGLGWISVDRRAGYRGRHVYTVHDEPVQPPLTADSDEGSGTDLGEGSLASKEHPQTDSPDEPPAGGSIRRRRTTGSSARPAVEDLPRTPTFRRAPERPEATFAPRIWRVLEPVKLLLPGLSPYVVRELAREIGRQLDEGQEPERLRTRLQLRFASTETIRDPGRWLLGAAVVRRGCGLTACESGRIWHTGVRCDVCARDRAAAAKLRRIEAELAERERQLGIDIPYRLADGQRPPRPPGPHRPGHPRPPGRWHECDACRAPSRTPLPGGVCRACRPPDLTTLLRRLPI
ncbi:hypothetical protein [Streptomyces beihaiensis]|uniref:Helix-turn-helix domain-containing protein n=1 Tax=Streptomyces beihaiensis TaxID=2984495 RepID=A0ABT3TRD2_9ACTN|nr:hypothetical protein [Streptomyces beihaiensis]MCX3059603.1 hypothetical protein [Streptomyces beihaiensis]